tara:strand:+ start:1144 stop:1836 length:693 start_codon:yes stop_codon:yes gene_type:complete
MEPVIWLPRVTKPSWTENTRCLPAHGYTANAYCRDGVKGSDGSWLKTTTSRIRSESKKIDLGWEWYGLRWEHKKLTPIYMEGLDVQFLYPNAPVNCRDGGAHRKTNGYHFPAMKGDNMGDLLIVPKTKKKWTKTAIERFTDMYRYTECESYNKNPYAFKLVGFEEIRKLKYKKPDDWESQCEKIERKFLEKINECILKRKNIICDGSNHHGGMLYTNANFKTTFSYGLWC